MQLSVIRAPHHRKMRSKNHQKRLLKCATGSTVQSLEGRQHFSVFHVDSTAALNGNGSQTSPWNQLTTVNSYTGFQSGDIVELSGTFINQPLQLQSAATGISITSANTSNPATIAETPDFSFISAIQVTTGGVSISDLNLVGPGITANNNSYFGIYFNNVGTTQLTGATVENVSVTGFVFAGLQISGSTKGFTNARITNSNFSDNQVSGIVVQGPANTQVHNNLLISNCVASYNAGAAIWWNANHVGQSENSSNGGIYVSSVSGADVTHCIAIGNCYNSAGAVGIWAYNAVGVVFEYDEAGDTASDKAGWDGNGFDFDFNVSDSLMQYDYSHGNAGAGLYICTYNGTANDTADTIRDCISADNVTYGIMLYSSGAHPTLGANIYNNTVLSTGTAQSALVVGGPGASLCTANFLNNIVLATNGATLINCASFTPANANLKFEGNDYWATGSPNSFNSKWGSTTYSSLSAFRSGAGEETLNGSSVGMNVDPQLVDEAVDDLAINNIANLEMTLASPLWTEGLNLTVSPFSNTSPYNKYAPYNLGGSAWDQLGSRDYFGFAVYTGSNQGVGANVSRSLNASGGSVTSPIDGTSSTATVYSNIRIARNAELTLVGNVQSVVQITGGLTLSGTTDAWTGTLDLASNDLILQNGDLSITTDQVGQAWNNNWATLGGITSSSATADPLHLASLGVIQNSIDGSTAGPVLYSTFDSVPSSSTDILIKYTLAGDANIDGAVDGSDYTRIDNGYLNNLTGWFNGDFNYDGTVDGSDYTLIDNAFNNQPVSAAAHVSSSVIQSADAISVASQNCTFSDEKKLKKRLADF